MGARGPRMPRRAESGPPVARLPLPPGVNGMSDRGRIVPSLHRVKLLRAISRTAKPKDPSIMRMAP